MREMEITNVIYLWLVPAIICYVLLSRNSKTWKMRLEDLVIVMPVINIVLAFLLLVVAILRKFDIK